MSNENQPQFEKDLAGAATPEEVEVEKVEPINDPSKSLDQGLIALYHKYLSQIDRQHEKGLIDSNKAEELTAIVLDLVEKDGLKEKIKFTFIERAKEIMGEGSFFGKKEVEERFGVEIEDPPVVPFSEAELNRAKELGQFLIYRSSHETFTMKGMNEKMNNKLGFDSRHHSNEPFFTEKIRPGWALVSRELIPDTMDKSYLDQAQVLASYLVTEVFRDCSVPTKYEKAIGELNAEKDTIRSLYGLYSDRDEHIEACKRLVSLKINQYLRHTPAEAIYDGLVQSLITHEWRWNAIYTNAYCNEGRSLVRIYYNEELGFNISEYEVFNSGITSTTFARRF